MSHDETESLAISTEKKVYPAVGGKFKSNASSAVPLFNGADVIEGSNVTRLGEIEVARDDFTYLDTRGRIIRVRWK